MLDYSSKVPNLSSKLQDLKVTSVAVLAGVLEMTHVQGFFLLKKPHVQALYYDWLWHLYFASFSLVDFKSWLCVIVGGRVGALLAALASLAPLALLALVGGSGGRVGRVMVGSRQKRFIVLGGWSCRRHF